MTHSAHMHPDDIRSQFSAAMSVMYKKEVPLYGVLLDLVSDVNEATLRRRPDLQADFERTGELSRISLERHGAIRVGSPEELHTLRRLFAIMGMAPVGYYDLSVAGMPVHSTAFRPITDASLTHNPFRVFTSLLRVDLITDEALRSEVAAILSRRNIFTPGALRLIERAEQEGGLTPGEADLFVSEALETFRWHGQASVNAETYERLSATHRLIADIVSFRGPHINHLTPRTLDIDTVQKEMPARGVTPKDVIEGPPPRACPILLRQTSFKALDEPISFPATDGTLEKGVHTARFGEIEQRGVALTRKGRALYDRLLADVREKGGSGSTASDYPTRLAEAFRDFPDDYDDIRQQGLGYFRYTPTDVTITEDVTTLPPEALVERGYAIATPIIYEDFLPVSAAGIFQSNLGGQERRSYAANANREMFASALGADLIDEFDLYDAAQARSIEATKASLNERSSTVAKSF
ncbi:VOC family protein [Acetobacter sp. DsW_063]|uniref:2-oxoadipate dioxygenase/decarboxylase HglS n=1 Tax=Acetobacter sp. DsW_063 TaxID=1514894 RepID=UPI000A3B13A1|nr:VOC family protein [Acetobacter sp. DsW_063]OUJ14780.1 hypothetical protein HK28_11530 [Acetobacter sp. DsW_063]